jgi:hypothetical protein
MVRVWNDPSMPLGRDQIIEEIKRTTNANGGTPLGIQRFLSETEMRDGAAAPAR